MKNRFFKDLIDWQKSMDLAVAVYSVVKQIPKEELYSLSDQMRRAAVSIPSNIAEGQQRNSPKDFYRFLCIANGSLGELETQLLLCEKLNYLKFDQIKPALELCGEVGKMLNGLMNNIQQTGNLKTKQAADNII